MRTPLIISGLIVLSFTLLLSCSPIFRVTAQFVNIDSDDPELELAFTFHTVKSRTTSVNFIQISNGDSLLCVLATRTEAGETPIFISEWTFPSIPDGFEFLHPKGATELPVLLKTEAFQFHFRGAGYGSWEYKPAYRLTENRWQFDEDGHQIFDISCQYEPWVGKDVVRIQLSEAVEIREESFQLALGSGEAVPFRFVYKKNPTDILALILEKAIPAGEILYLSFEIEPGKPIHQLIPVPPKDQVGVIGKFHGME